MDSYLMEKIEATNFEIDQHDKEIDKALKEVNTLLNKMLEQRNILNQVSSTGTVSLTFLNQEIFQILKEMIESITLYFDFEDELKERIVNKLLPFVGKQITA